MVGWLAQESGPIEAHFGSGENIALNNYINFYPMAQTVRQTNADFMNSPEHRANLLEPKYAEIGLGMAFERRSSKLVVTDVFVQP